MEILKKIILTNNRQPILLQYDSRNNNLISKIYKSTNTNFLKNFNNKSHFHKNKNYEIKLKKNIKIPSYINKTISLDKKNNSRQKYEKEQSIDYHTQSYRELDKNNFNNKIYTNNNISQTNSSYSFNKDLIVNNNIVNNISNHITKIIISNNNIKKNIIKNNKKLNLDEKKLLFYNNSNKTSRMNIIKNSNVINQKKNLKKSNNLKSTLKRNNNLIKYSFTSGNKIKNNLCLSNRNKILSQKLISFKDINNKIISEKNKNKINECFKYHINCSSNSIFNKNLYLIKNNKRNKDKIYNYSHNQLINKKKNNNHKNININLKKKNKSKYKEKIKNIEKSNNSSKLNNSKLKLKENYSLNCLKKKYPYKNNPSFKCIDDTATINNVNSKEKTKIKNLKINTTTKNYITNICDFNTSRERDKNIVFKYLKDKNISFINKDKTKKQYNSLINFNTNEIKNFNQLRYLITSKYCEKSLSDKNNNSSSDLSMISTKRNFKNNLNMNNKKHSYSKIHRTVIGFDSKFKIKYKPKKKYYNIIKNKNKTKLINENEENYAKTERSNGNLNNINIDSLNNLSKKMYLEGNKSFIINYKNNILNNKRTSVNMNIYKNLKREFFTKSLIKNVDTKNFYFNNKNNSYSSYKDQYLLNMVNSFKNISYISQEKNNKKKEKMNKYYNNQKKIHENKLYINKLNNRCKKKNLDLSEINIHHNDLVNLIKVKFNKNKTNLNNKLASRDIIKGILYKKRISPEIIFRNKYKYKNEYYSYDENKIKDKDNSTKKNILERKKYELIPFNIIKNILNINNIDKINSARISPNIFNNNIIKNNISKKKTNNKNSNKKNNKSFKITMHHDFNIPNNNVISLNKKKKIRNSDMLIIINKKDENNKKDLKIKNINEDDTTKREVIKNSDKKFESYEISENEIEKSNKKEIEEKIEIDKNQNIINENIKNNPQYLGEYLIDILENLLLEESVCFKKKYINPDYLFSINNKELTPEIRLVSINWLIMILHKVFKFKENTLFISIQLVDRFLSKKMLSIEKTELLLLACLILASKHEEIDYVNMKEALQLSGNKFTKNQIVSMENEILSELNFEIIMPTMNDYFNIFCIILNLSDIERNKGLFLLNIVLIDFYMLEYSNFILSLSVIKLITKKSVKSLIKILTDLLIKNNEEICLNMLKNEDIIDIVTNKIRKLYKKYNTTKYKNIQEKFSDEKYNSVSNLLTDLI